MQEKFSLQNRIKKVSKKALRAAIFLLGGVVLLFGGVFLAMKFHLTYVKGQIDPLSQFFNKTQSVTVRKAVAQQTVGPWTDTPEWQVISAGFIKDQAVIEKASEASGVPPRIIVATVISEQFRFFDSNREAFKKFFEPLKILGNATQFSYGVAGIKTDTAKTVEDNLKDPTSPYYLGPNYEHSLDFSTNDPDKERMDRLTDPNNHYYSYLYTALLLKEEMTQWQNAGYPINNRPEILATLFNIGFDHSNPNPEPETGGSTITINGKDYTFGNFAFNFYYSNELKEQFS
jgi:hypothetical protein